MPCLRPKRTFPRLEFRLQRRKEAVTPGCPASTPPGEEPSSAACEPGEGESTLQLPEFCGMRRCGPHPSRKGWPHQPSPERGWGRGWAGQGGAGGGGSASGAPGSVARGARGPQRGAGGGCCWRRARSPTMGRCCSRCARDGRDGRPRREGEFAAQSFPALAAVGAALRASGGWGGLGGESAPRWFGPDARCPAPRAGAKA